MLSKDNLQKVEAYTQLALAHAKIRGRGGKGQPSLPTIRPGTAEFSEWQRYFLETLGFEPLAMKRVAMGQSREMTVPEERPEMFDASYRPMARLAAE
jgi:hypothetical protein